MVVTTVAHSNGHFVANLQHRLGGAATHVRFGFGTRGDAADDFDAESPQRYLRQSPDSLSASTDYRQSSQELVYLWAHFCWWHRRFHSNRSEVFCRSFQRAFACASADRSPACRISHSTGKCAFLNACFLCVWEYVRAVRSRPGSIYSKSCTCTVCQSHDIWSGSAGY